MVVFRFIDKNLGYSEYFSKKTLDNNKSSLHYKMVKEITFSFSTFHENFLDISSIIAGIDSNIMYITIRCIRCCWMKDD